MKPLFQTFLWHYKLFSAASLAAAIAFVLELAGYHAAAHWVLAIVALVAVSPLLWSMFQDLRMGTYGIDILAAAAIGTAVIMHEYWAAMVVVLMLTGGEALEDYAGHRAKKELEALLSRAPQKARVLRGRTEVTVKVGEVRAGDKIIIRPGEAVPVDAAILEGTASFDESSLTGESLPQTKQPGQDILSGSINLDGAVTARALRSAADSQYQQIIKLVRAAENSRAPFVRLADRYAVPFTVVSFVIAGAAWAVSGQPIRFLEVLVVATPCPLILAAPIAIISGMSRAAKHGIIIKTGSALERLGSARSFAFDKTGTLTKGILAVEGIQTYGAFTAKDILRLSASLEQHSNHVLSQAILARARQDNLKLAKGKNMRELAGRGLAATIGRQHILAGNFSLLEEQGVRLPAAVKAQTPRQTAAFVAVDGELAGIITFSDQLRPEGKATLFKLRQLGIRHILMVTGDNHAAAQAVAKKLNITEVVADALPAGKLQIIEKLTDRPVAFVGDGINDAPVLTAADVGIALGARGSAAASESADVVIMQDDLARVATSVDIAKHTFHIARQSILVGIGLSIGLMFVFATGRFKPVYGALIQELVDVVVIFNALRAHGGGENGKNM